MLAIPLIALITFGQPRITPVLQAIPIQGVVESPHDTHRGAAAFALTGPTTFGWRTGQLSASVDIGDHAFLVDTGGGNETILSGRISGSGTFEWRSGGVPQVAQSILRGDTANTFSGTFTLSKGVLDIELPAGQNAFQGPLVVGGRDRAVVNLHANETLPDTQTITFTGPKDTGIVLNGVTETIAGCQVRNHASIDFSGASSLKLTSSTAIRVSRGATLSIVNFNPAVSRFAVAAARYCGSQAAARLLHQANGPRSCSKVRPLGQMLADLQRASAAL
jgi:hypothetical protein